jgi:hypothetical protein
MTSSTRKILIGLGLGVLVGLFLGERAAVLQFATDGYVRLLQMTVLPFTLVLWGLALGAVFLMPLAFPTTQSASFFSTTLIEEQAPLDLVALYPGRSCATSSTG